MPELLEFPSALLSSTHISWLDAIESVLVAFVFGQIVAWTYERTYGGLSYSRGFSQTLVLICFTACVFVMAIGRSFYAGLGLLGVLSIIRFRANLKAPRDLVFLMSSATFGVAVGVGAIAVGTIGTLGFSAVVFYLHYGPLGTRKRFDGLLRFYLSAQDNVAADVEGVLRRHCLRTALLSVNEIAQGQKIEHTYQVKFLKQSNRELLLGELRRELRASDARLLLQEVSLEY